MSNKILLNVLTTHFNTENHFLDLSTFITTAQNIQDIANDFKRKHFPELDDIVLQILPPEPGTFKLKTALKVSGVTLGLAWAALESDIGKAYILGLTGHEPAYYSEQAGQATADSLIGGSDERNAETLLLTDMTRGFLEKSTQELFRIGIAYKSVPNAYAAKNQFLEICKRNPDIKSVGFDDSETFPIKKSNIHEYMADIPINNVEMSPLSPESFLIDNNASIAITSPDWLNKRQWKIIYDNKPYNIKIVDEEFWAKIESQELHTKIIDNMRLQLAFISEGNKRKNLIGIKVLTFNGEEIGNKLSTEDIQKELEKLNTKDEGNSNQLHLDFD